jgi:hypothetical protein
LLNACLQKHSFIYFVKTLPTGSEFGFIFIITLIGSQFANFLGPQHALNTIEGKMPTSVSANFISTKGDTIINPKLYRLVFTDSNGFYLVKIQVPAPKSPEILFISRSEVAKIEMKSSE